MDIYGFATIQDFTAYLEYDDSFEPGYELLLQRLPDDLSAPLKIRIAWGEGHPFPYLLDSKQEILVAEQSIFNELLLPNQFASSHRDDSQRRDVFMGAKELWLAVFLYCSRYCNMSDARFEFLARLLSNEWDVTKTRGIYSELSLKFNELATGFKSIKVDSGYQQVPSTIVRKTDGARPYDHINPNGSRGFSGMDEPALFHWIRYTKLKNNFTATYPSLDFVLLVKRALRSMLPEKARDEVFTDVEAERNEIFEIAEDLRSRYQEAKYARYEASSDEKEKDTRSYDLLDCLISESLLMFVNDERADIEARRMYLNRLESHIACMETDRKAP